MIKNKDKILILGGSGLVGSAFVRELIGRGHDINSIDRPSSSFLDLTSQTQVETFFNNREYDYVIIAAAKVGGIVDNATHKAEFLAQNLRIQTNVMLNIPKNVKKVMFLGSSCVYPKDTQIPIKEESFLTGPPEVTNDSYAIAKIAGIKLAQALDRADQRFINLMPSNLYGMNDRFGYHGAHVIPALITKYHRAVWLNEKLVRNLGTGNALREFLYVDDFAAIALDIFEKYDSSDIVNVGTGSSVSIRELAETIAQITGYEGETEWSGKYDGISAKTLDITKMENILGSAWHYHSLGEGLWKTYKWFINNKDNKL